MRQSYQNNPYDYYFGDEMFIAPVYEQFATKRELNLPQGKWVNFLTNQTVDGGEKIEVNAPVCQIPLFIRQGSIIPMRNYSSSIEKGNNDTLTIHIYPGKSGHFKLIEDDGTSNDYMKGIFATTKIKLKSDKKSDKLVIKPIVGNFDGMKPDRTVKLIIHSSKKIKKIKFGNKNVFQSKTENTAETSFCLINKNKKNTFTIIY